MTGAVKGGDHSRDCPSRDRRNPALHGGTAQRRGATTEHTLIRGDPDSVYMGGPFFESGADLSAAPRGFITGQADPGTVLVTVPRQWLTQNHALNHKNTPLITDHSSNHRPYH
ncbi:hypothetical protein AAFF_G00441100 [Aldrovandia affinis]|uniref:Uncharacterized protein n=1 Tax=Aldrovandia affinis TaxID=143900 RepID=A0AAD7S786_9TELE|nr:hypothetical protein AAFF_G00441100 [Aldrovandia affinis]